MLLDVFEPRFTLGRSKLQMRELTTADIFALHDQLEEKAATLVGRILFAFSRLEMELGLCVVWVDHGTRLEQLTDEHEETGFNARLSFLRKSVDERFPKGSKRHSAYSDWIYNADALRQVRNELVHGRWGIEATEERIVNVLGLPTSQKQRSVSYSLEQLQQVYEKLGFLLTGLGTLRQKWPL